MGYWCWAVSLEIAFDLVTSSARGQETLKFIPMLDYQVELQNSVRGSDQGHAQRMRLPDTFFLVDFVW